MSDSMTTHEVSIAGKTADLWMPAGTVERTAIFLHGYDNAALGDQSAFLVALQAAQTACLCPRGPGCWWLDVVYPPFDASVTPVEFLRTAAREYLTDRFPRVASPPGLFGFEMGGQGALQVAYRWPRLFPNVVAISPKVDFETWHGFGTTLDQLFSSREEARQQIATLQLNPLNWPRRQLLLCDPQDQYCLDGVVTLASKLSSSGVPFDHDFETSHGGFGWKYANAMASRAIGYLSE